MDQSHFNSPIGHLELAADEIGIRHIRFPLAGAAPAYCSATGNPHLEQLKEELSAYFAGSLTTFRTALNPEGTDFQKRVWKALAQLPFGLTTSYGAIARSVGNPNASRAVGGANNRNPLPIVVPCHRVLGKDLSMVGYAGELWRKRWLLEHEGIALPLG